MAAASSDDGELAGASPDEIVAARMKKWHKKDFPSSAAARAVVQIRSLLKLATGMPVKPADLPWFMLQPFGTFHVFRAPGWLVLRMCWCATGGSVDEEAVRTRAALMFVLSSFAHITDTGPGFSDEYEEVASGESNDDGNQEGDNDGDANDDAQTSNEDNGDDGVSAELVGMVVGSTPMHEAIRTWHATGRMTGPVAM